ncbi:hypothetical protein IIY59_01095 [Candidatus Saccharibacteria bacterium]|nr:hypothetical protein [Candidatus Saccharibacteria bacterium]
MDTSSGVGKQWTRDITDYYMKLASSGINAWADYSLGNKDIRATNM